jgi:hypothetical protein
MIVWGGVFCCPVIDFDTGGRYDATTEIWTATSTENVPFARANHAAVWSGSEMIVWADATTSFRSSSTPAEDTAPNRLLHQRLHPQQQPPQRDSHADLQSAAES